MRSKQRYIEVHINFFYYFNYLLLIQLFDSEKSRISTHVSIQIVGTCINKIFLKNCKTFDICKNIIINSSRKICRPRNRSFCYILLARGTRKGSLLLLIDSNVYASFQISKKCTKTQLKAAQLYISKKEDDDQSVEAEQLDA